MSGSPAPGGVGSFRSYWKEKRQGGEGSSPWIEGSKDQGHERKNDGATLKKEKSLDEKLEEGKLGVVGVVGGRWEGRAVMEG